MIMEFLYLLFLCFVAVPQDLLCRLFHKRSWLQKLDDALDELWGFR